MSEISNLDLSYIKETMHEVDCPICCEKDYKIVSEGHGRGGIFLKYVICEGCGHIYMKNRPSNLGYNKFYESGDYRILTKPTKRNLTSSNISSDEHFSKKAYSHGERLYNNHLKNFLNEGDIVFDFGAGNGAWLYGLQKVSKCKVEGLEPSKSDVENINKILNANIYCGLIEDFQDKIIADLKNKVSVAIISGSLQHMIDPMKCLFVAKKILRPGGLLYVCNKDIFSHYLSLFSPDPRKFDDLRTIDHPHYFYCESYKQMIERSGMRVVHFGMNSSVRYVHMEIIAKKDNKFDFNKKNINTKNVLIKIRIMEICVVIFNSLPTRIIRRMFRDCKKLLKKIGIV